MNVYTVHVKGSPEDSAALERSVFVREGFSWAAFVFGPLWLLWNRLWMGLVLWLLAEAALVAWVVAFSPPGSVIFTLQVLLNLALALEAAQLRRRALARRRFPMVGVVHGRRLADAERFYFAGIEKAPAEVAASASRARSPEMVGLFPSTGA